MLSPPSSAGSWLHGARAMGAPCHAGTPEKGCGGCLNSESAVRQSQSARSAVLTLQEQLQGAEAGPPGPGRSYSFRTRASCLSSPEEAMLVTCNQMDRSSDAEKPHQL